MRGSNVTQLAPVLKDGDGPPDNLKRTESINIEVADNGYTVNVYGETSSTKVFLFSAKGEDGPKGMIQMLIDELGINDKVKLEK